MKNKKLDNHQLEACRLIQVVMSDMIGGYENQMSDSEEGSEDWNTAYEFLKTERTEMIELIYEMTIAEARHRKSSKHINFAGTEFMKLRINKELTDWGY